MASRRRARFVALTTLIAARFEVGDPVQAVVAGHVQVDGRFITNPNARVRTDSAVRVTRPTPLRGEVKLGTGLDALDVDVSGLLAVDIGAAAGGFTRALLERGARRVFAVDVGHGQLVGSLRQDSRVVNLERTNVADLSPTLIPDQVDIVTMDLSYLPVSEAVRCLHALHFGPEPQMVVLVKPTFELHRGELETDEIMVRAAITRAATAIEEHGWTIRGITLPMTTGANGAVESFIDARR